tara:strand:- start:7160 stop:7624 length:465 start_codon:yes stop_codon:yes gene_type:complete
MIRTVIALATACLVAAAAHAQDAPTARETAERWLDAYETQDFDAIRALLTDGSRFIDPTSFERPEVSNPIDWTGPDAIIEGIAAWGMTAGHYTIHNTFEASGRVVFQAEMRVTYGAGEAAVSYLYPIVTIVTVEDGHVAEHRDYTDFNGMRRAQ